jgi:hypothetical protein
VRYRDALVGHQIIHLGILSVGGFQSIVRICQVIGIVVDICGVLQHPQHLGVINLLGHNGGAQAGAEIFRGGEGAGSSGLFQRRHRILILGLYALGIDKPSFPRHPDSRMVIICSMAG